MLQETLLQLYERDLNKLIGEINQYRDENNLWLIKEGISNSGGNLCLHLLGNLNLFIGATLGNTGYIRNRDAEFSLKNIPRAELIGNIEKTIPVVCGTIGRLTAADFEKEFPLEINARKATTAHILVHLLSHLAYHLGQVNYHRRITEGN
jgi:uncharacterized damage-inducible protein DinB